MLPALRWVLAGLLVALVARYRFRLPVFCLYSLAAFVALVYSPVELWRGLPWFREQEILIALRIGSALEVLWLIGEGLPLRPRVSLAGFATAAGSALMTFGWIHPPGLYAGMAYVLRQIEAGILFAIGAGFLLAWRQSVKIRPFLKRHAVLFSVLMASQLWMEVLRFGPGEGSQWRMATAAQMLIGCACAVGWIRIAGAARPPATGHSSPQLPAECP